MRPELYPLKNQCYLFLYMVDPLLVCVYHLFWWISSLSWASSGVPGFLVFHGVSDSLWSGDAMAIGHLWKSGHSVSKMHVVDVLLRTAFKNFQFFAEEEVGSKRQIPAASSEEGREVFIGTCL